MAWCLFKEESWLYFLSHGQMCDTPLCVALSCLFKLCLSVNLVPHLMHLISIIPRHMFSCCLLRYWLINLRGQLWHVYGLTSVCLFKWNWYGCFPQPSNGQIKCWAFSWRFLCTWAKWLSRFYFVLKVFSAIIA